MDTGQTLLLIGRILAGGGFLIVGLRNIRNHCPITGLMKFRYIPFPAFAAAFGIGMQIVFGLGLALGVYQTICALGLAAFMIMATALAHSPFMGTPEERTANVSACLVNSAMVGGLLALAAVGLPS
ncbi:MAG TPA: DoxX family protein [Hyphomonadaceae bacterium]|nr:DoxX family protein [Hyphomonadaceae bacterium]